MVNLSVDISHLAMMCDKAFDKRLSLLSLWQEISDNFYPERAEFTTTRSLGSDFASNLTTSEPILARRDMGDMFSSMLRPMDVYWFKIQADGYDRLPMGAKGWLQAASRAQWGGMYDTRAQFQKSTKQGDHDYVTFGQCAISTEWDANRNHLIYKCWHLRDMAWYDNDIGEPCPIFRRWTLSAYDAKKIFGDNISEEIRKLADDKTRQFEDVTIYHAVTTPDMVGAKVKTPYVSVFFEKETKKLLKAEGVWTKIYTIPRWQTVSGSQYAYSPATVAALPDARLIQQMTLVLLEAGEKAVNPPLIATQDVVRSDIGQFAGGITWVDSEYDERLGDALRPMTINSNGIPHGLQMREEIRKAIQSAFYLDKIGLPPMGAEMTAYETAQRVKEYMRKLIPLFSPIEAEYNAGICETTFTTLMKAGQFGAVQDIPQELQGQDVKFVFRSPLSENLDRQKVQSFNEAKQMLAETIPLDQSVARMIDIRKALRDVFENGIDTPMQWLVDEDTLKQQDEAMAEKQRMQEIMAQMGQGAEIGKTMGEATKNFNQAGVGM